MGPVKVNDASQTIQEQLGRLWQKMFQRRVEGTVVVVGEVKLIHTCVFVKSSHRPSAELFLFKISDNSLSVRFSFYRKLKLCWGRPGKNDAPEQVWSQYNLFHRAGSWKVECM
jgi:hypothetical protein